MRYTEGQWFALPLSRGYALGVFARGSSRARGGLAYFFAPYELPPTESDTLRCAPERAVLVAWVGDWGIVSGRWSPVPSSRPFAREEWPVPAFAAPDRANPAMGWRVEYPDDADGWTLPAKREYVPAEALQGLPLDGIWGDAAVELFLSRLVGQTVNTSEAQARG